MISSILNFKKIPNRVNRSEFLIRIATMFLFTAVIAVVIGLIAGATSIVMFFDSDALRSLTNTSFDYKIIPTLISSFIIIALGIYSFMYCLVCSVKRLHDFNYNGWWILLYFVPFINVLFQLALISIPGIKSHNRFGQSKQKKYNSFIVALAGILFILVSILPSITTSLEYLLYLIN